MNRGFTLVELLIVLGITIVLAASALPIYGSFQVNTQVQDSTSQLIQTLRTAQLRSKGRMNDSAHGVYFRIHPTEQDSYTLYQGSSYSTRNSSLDREVVLDAGLSLSTGISGTDLNFSMGKGIPSETGTVVITHDVNGSETITISSLGTVKK